MLQELTRIAVIVMETCRSRILYAIHIKGAVRILFPEHEIAFNSNPVLETHFLKVKKEMKLCTDVRISDCAIVYMCQWCPLCPLEKGTPQNLPYLEKGTPQAVKSAL